MASGIFDKRVKITEKGAFRVRIPCSRLYYDIAAEDSFFRKSFSYFFDLGVGF